MNARDDIVTKGGLVFVHPDDIHAYWPYIEPRLQIVKRKTKARWFAEDVYASIKAGQSTLHIGEQGDEYLGFIVLQPSGDYDGKVLWVWIVYSDQRGDVFDQFEPEIIGFARRMSAKRIAFSSPREWTRRLPGYSKAHYVYEKEV